MDSYHLDDYNSGPHELSLSAEDIEAIGSGYHSPATQAAADQAPQPDVGASQVDEHEEAEPLPGHGPADMSMDMDDDGDFLPEVTEDSQQVASPVGEPAVPEHPGEAGSSTTRRLSNKEAANMTAEEKKKRQRENNKRAAERSRAKRRQNMDSTETQITEVRKENERLRARLNALRQASPAFANLPGPVTAVRDNEGRRGSVASGPVIPQPIDPLDIGFDRTWVDKLALELVGAKAALLEKHFELERARGAAADEDLENARRELVGKHAAIGALRAEQGAMETVLGLLHEEKVELGARRRAIEVELLRRGADAEAGSPSSAAADEGEDELRRAREQEAASHTQVLAQAVRDVAMGEARHLSQDAEEGEEAPARDVYDIQPYIEQAVADWHQHHDADRLHGLDIEGHTE